MSTGVQVAEGRVVRLGPCTWCVESTPAAAANAGIVVGEAATLVVDSRLTPALGRDLLEAARRLSAAPDAPVHLVNTHFHGDHCFGNEAFGDRLGIATDWTRRALSEHWDAQVRAFTELRPHQADVYRAVRRTVPALGLSGAAELDLGGGAAAILRPVGHAHTPGDLVVEVPADGVVYTGDVVFHGHWPMLWDADVGGWLSALEALRAARPAHVVPGHGPAGAREVIDAMVGGLELLVRHASRPQGASVGEAVASTELADWLHPQRIEPALDRIRVALREDPTLAARAGAPRQRARRAGRMES